MQTRITDHFSGTSLATEPRPAPRVTFMDLPRELRMRVYEYLNLTPRYYSWRTIELSRTSVFDRTCLFKPAVSEDRHQHEDDNACSVEDANEDNRFAVCHLCQGNYWVNEEGKFRPSPGAILPSVSGYCEDSCTGIPVSLFRVCRAWSADAVFAFYSTNAFASYYLPGRGLSPAVLQNLRPSTLKALRKLTVRLSMGFCDSCDETGRSCSLATHQLDCHPSCKVVGHDTPLQWERPNVSKTVIDWVLFCQKLAASIEPESLDLTLIANAGSIDLAEALVEPIRALPTLRNCSISLSKQHNSQMVQLADKTTLKAIGCPESRIHDPFSFRGLPDELQLQVLRHTGLKAPYHLWCDRAKPGTPAHCEWSIAPQCIYRPDAIENAACVLCCTGARAHSAANPKCHCWVLSLAPLQVDRRMRAMAQTILYRENTWALDLAAFVAHRGFFPGYWDDLLAHARHLQVYASTHDTAMHEAYNEPSKRWVRFVHQLARRHAAPHQLTISLIMLHPDHAWEPGRPSAPVSRTVQVGAEWAGHRVFADVAAHYFRKLGLRPKDVFVRILRQHHTIGLGGARWQARTRHQSPVCDQHDFARQERELERLIRNDDGYDTRLGPKSRMIHEATHDVEEDLVRSLGVNSWKPFLHENSCTQCGGGD